MTALMVAALQGHAPMVARLLARGASVRAMDNYHRTALMFASMSGSVDCVRVLLAHGARRADRDEVSAWYTSCPIAACWVWNFTLVACLAVPA